MATRTIERVVQVSKNIMGPVAEGIIKRQCELLGISGPDVTAEQIKSIADMILKNTVILIGKNKAADVKNKLYFLAEDV